MSQEAQSLFNQSDAPHKIVEESGRDKDEPEGGKDSGEASGEIADDSVYAPKNIAGATGSTYETRTSYNEVSFLNEETHRIETKTEETNITYTYHFRVVPSKEAAQGFYIENKYSTVFEFPDNVLSDKGTARFRAIL